MPHEAICPSCKHRLLIPEETAGVWLTCPRCLTTIRNPNDQVTAAPSGAAPAVEDRPRSCPGCGRAVEPGWRSCPHCEEPLRRKRPPREPLPLERNVHRDTQSGTVAAIILGCLLLAGVVIFLGFGGPALVGASKEGPAILMVGGGLIAAVVIGCIVIALTGRSRGASIASSVVGGVVLGGGLVLLMGFLLWAAFISFLESCGKGCH
jgi:Double zinc ribbon